MENLQVGMTATAQTSVSDVNTAQHMGSGALAVFATPAMCALMEKAAMLAVQPYLQEGEGTVGVALEITHDAPSPLGAVVEACATLQEIDGRKLSFTVEAFEGSLCIGKGTHTRFIIQNDKFMQKLTARSHKK